jgi:HEAT repeats/HEAT repeat
MIAPLVAGLLLAVQTPVALDSATAARVLSQLRASDSTICALAGQALTNYGGFWGWNYSEPGMALPRPMPTPMPMPGGGGGGIHVGMFDKTHDVDPGVLRAFRAFIRDDNRCVRHIAARVLGRHGGSTAYDLFVTLLRDARPDLRETGALGLGELEDSRAIAPLGDVLDRDDSPAVRMTAAWALGEIEEKPAIDALGRALGDRAPEVRRTAAWALGRI